jgi:hypothetical protein
LKNRHLNDYHVLVLPETAGIISALKQIRDETTSSPDENKSLEALLAKYIKRSSFITGKGQARTNQ